MWRRLCYKICFFKGGIGEKFVVKTKISLNKSPKMQALSYFNPTFAVEYSNGFTFDL